MHNATTLPPTAITARLPAGLKSESDVYAASLGISLNALIAVALREYLDARAYPKTPPEALEPALAALPVQVPPSPAPAPQKSAVALPFKAPKSRNAPCPCGARTPEGGPLRFKYCHGKGLV